jgi:hypothetical protein
MPITIHIPAIFAAWQFWAGFATGLGIGIAALIFTVAMINESVLRAFSR